MIRDDLRALPLPSLRGALLLLPRPSPGRQSSSGRWRRPRKRSPGCGCSVRRPSGWGIPGRASLSAPNWNGELDPRPTPPPRPTRGSGVSHLHRSSEAEDQATALHHQLGDLTAEHQQLREQLEALEEEKEARARAWVLGPPTHPLISFHHFKNTPLAWCRG